MLAVRDILLHCSVVLAMMLHLDFEITFSEKHFGAPGLGRRITEPGNKIIGFL